MAKLLDIRAAGGFRLALRYDDGRAGVVDLQELRGRGVFAAWDTPGEFEKVRVGEAGDAVWECGVDLCPDMLYMKLTGQTVEHLFPGLAKVGFHA